MSRPNDTTHYLPASDYIKPIETLNTLTNLIALSIGEYSDGLRGIISRNFLARGMNCLNSIHQIWQIGNYQDCWTLHRSLVERLFTIKSLDDQNEFEKFDDWSFIRQYKGRNRILSDPNLRKKLLETERTFTQEETSRYLELNQRKISWKRPDAKQIAKEMGLSFLYTLAYDFASTHVHPMANDGEDDFLRVFDATSEPHYNQIVVLHNSIIIQLLLITAAMNASRLLWRAIIDHYIKDFFSLLETGSEEYLVTFGTITSLPPFDLCRRTTSN